MASEHTNLANGRLAPVFATYVSSYQWTGVEEMNARLRAAILTAEKAGPGVSRSNVGGWHSSPDLLKWPDPAIAEFSARLGRYATDLVRLTTEPEVHEKGISARVDGWANVSREGNYNAVHDHPDSHWSGVYFVSCGTRRDGIPNNGRLELLDPRAGVHSLSVPGSRLVNRVYFDPVPGLMVFFPSWLPHMVHPYFGEGERISISYNVRLAMREEG